MDKNEGKYYNTACLMDEALIQLINEKDYDYITIKEICKRAGVNRSTFYLHYETIDDLLDEATNHFFDNFYEQMHNAGKTKKNVKDSIVNNDKDSLMLVNDDYLRPYLTFIKENKKIYQASYKSPMISSSKRQYEMMLWIFLKYLFQGKNLFLTIIFKAYLQLLNVGLTMVVRKVLMRFVRLLRFV